MSAQRGEPWPADPIAAVTHPDPWPYYAWLAEQPMHRHERLGVWVAASQDDVLAVLTHPHALVRPASAPVPPHLVGSIAGTAFGALPRMTDGPDHQPRRAPLEALIGGWTPSSVAAACEDAASDSAAWTPTTWLDVFPTAVLSRLLDLAVPIEDAVGAARALATAFGPSGRADDVAAASAAVDRLSTFCEHPGSAVRDVSSPTRPLTCGAALRAFVLTSSCPFRRRYCRHLAPLRPSQCTCHYDSPPGTPQKPAARRGAGIARPAPARHRLR